MQGKGLGPVPGTGCCMQGCEAIHGSPGRKGGRAAVPSVGTSMRGSHLDLGLSWLWNAGMDICRQRAAPTDACTAAALKEQAAEERGPAVRPARRPTREKGRAQPMDDDAAPRSEPCPPPGSKPRRHKARPNPASLGGGEGPGVKREQGDQRGGREDGGVPAQPPRRRRGDEELERELQMAMAATAFQAPSCASGKTTAAGSSRARASSEAEPLVFRPRQADITGEGHRWLWGMGGRATRREGGGWLAGKTWALGCSNSVLSGSKAW